MGRISLVIGGEVGNVVSRVFMTGRKKMPYYWL
jgi:hypothetical protein